MQFPKRVFCALEYWTMEKVQKPINSVYSFLARIIEQSVFRTHYTFYPSSARINVHLEKCAYLFGPNIDMKYLSLLERNM
jgi:hypothetical protein